MLSATAAVVDATVFAVFAGFVAAATGADGAAHGLLGLLFHAALVTGAVLSLPRRVPLERGAVALLVAAPATTGAFPGGNPRLAPWYLGARGLAAVAGTGAGRLGDTAGTRLLGAGVAVAFATAHVAAVAVRDDRSRTVHLRPGAVFLTGVVGLLLATLATAPGTRPAG